MTVTEELVGPGKGVTRDRYGRPLVTPPQPINAKPTPYTRATTVAKTLEDTSALMAWKQRMTTLGLVSRRDLLTAAAATDPGDKKELNRIAEQAADAGGATAAATTGTALHAFTERIDTDMDLGHVPEEYKADLDAYRRLAEQVGWIVRGVEEFLVLDSYRIAGTADRILEIDGRHYIGDVKTGSSVAYPHAWAAQLAIYSRSMRYDVETNRRTAWDVIPDQNRALVVHVPAGQGRADAYWIDVKAGWESVHLAMKVRQWRKTRNLLTPWTESDPILDAIESAETVDQLTATWELFRTEWTEAHTEAAKAKKTSLTASAA